MVTTEAKNIMIISVLMGSILMLGLLLAVGLEFFVPEDQNANGVPIGPKCEQCLNPHWNPRTGLLTFVDAPAKLGYRLDPFAPEGGGRPLEKVSFPDPPGFLLPLGGDKDMFIANAGLDFYLGSWSQPDDNLTKIDDLQMPLNFNATKWSIDYAVADPSGRLWLCVNYDTQSTIVIYSLRGINGTFQRQLQLDGQAGIDFNFYDERIFITSSVDRKILSYKVNFTTGVLSRREIVFHMNRRFTGRLAGTRLDEFRMLWVIAEEQANGCYILVVNPSAGSAMRHLNLPIRTATDLIFVGPMLNAMAVTAEGSETLLLLRVLSVGYPTTPFKP